MSVQLCPSISHTGGGGEVKGRPLRKKEVFEFFLNFFCCHLKIKMIGLQLIEIWTCHVKVCRNVFLLGCYNIFQGKEKKIVKSVSGYFMTKKNPIAIKPGGGGLCLKGPVIKKITFFAASLSSCKIFLKVFFMSR